LLTLQIYTLQMAPPDMSVATYHLLWFCRYLEDHGYVILQRDKDRIIIAATVYTIWHAVHCVFFTHMVTSTFITNPNEFDEFKFEHVHYCQPFMVCTFAPCAALMP